MYFTPILFAVITILLFPSYLVAGIVGLSTAAYFRFAGLPVAAQTIKLLRGQIAYRLLSVKLLQINGEMDEDTYMVHSQLTPDEPENSELRGLLRDAAAKGGDGWKDQARIVRKVYGSDPLQIVDRFEMLIVQLNATPHGVTDDSQMRLVEISKMWNIGREKALELFAESKIDITAKTLAW